MSGETSISAAAARQDTAAQPGRTHGATQPVRAHGASAVIAPSQRGRRSFWQVFGMVVVLALVSTVGLIAALIGDGLYDAVSWITLTIPVIVIGKSLK